MLKSLINWTRDWFEKNGNPETKAIIGISGGKDSSVVAGLLVEALGKDRVLGIQMPCGDQVDIDDSNAIIKHLGINSFTVNIQKAYESLNLQITKNLNSFNDKNLENYRTNTPARLRMTTLYGIAALEGNSRVANTGNLSESVLGYHTFYGDLAGDFAPIAELTTSEVKELGRSLNLPEEFINKTPSDGMSFDKDGFPISDEDKLGLTYDDINICIRSDNPEEELSIKYGGDFDIAMSIIKKVLKLYQENKYKIDIIGIPSFKYGNNFIPELNEKYYGLV